MYHDNKPVVCEECSRDLRFSSIKALEPELTTFGDSDVDSYMLEVAMLYACDACTRVYALYDKWSWSLDSKLSNPAIGDVEIDPSSLKLIYPLEKKKEKKGGSSLPDGAVSTKKHLTLYLGGRSDTKTIDTEIENDPTTHKLLKPQAKRKTTRRNTNVNSENEETRE